MKYARSLIVPAVFVAIAVGVMLWLYPRLPAEVPTHWDLHNHVNGTMPRFWAAAFPALSVLVLAVLSVALPAISPRQFAIRPFAGAWGILMLVAQGLVLVLGLGVLLAGAGYVVSVPTITMLAVGVLYMVLGNYMGKLCRNFFIGIRTPWTLASDAVWERTHRFGGRLFMLGGLMAIVIALIDPAPWLLLIVVLAVLSIAAGYSYFIHLQLEGSR
jgi:uncharacterized membrane protein